MLVVAILALGIGVNVTMVGTVDRLLLRAPPHVRDPDQLVRVLLSAPGPEGGQQFSSRLSYPAFRDLQRDVPGFAGVAAHSSAIVSFGSGPEATEARASLVSPEFFSILGVRASIGRLFSVNEDREEGEASIAALGHGFWQRTFGGDSAVLGRSIRVGSFSYTVIGITPEGFGGLQPAGTDLWLPISVAAERESRLPLSLHDRGSPWVSVIARLRRGISDNEVERQATNAWRHFNTVGGDDQPLRSVVLAPIAPARGPDRPREARVAVWLGGVSVIVLLIACSNVANLLLARAFVRRREIGVRLALGATRARLARQMLAEGMVLATAGAAAALYLAALGGRVTGRLILTPDTAMTFVDARLFVATAAIALGTGVLISLAPLMQTSSGDLGQYLRSAGAVTARRAARVRLALLATQAALCMVLLIGAGLFAASLRRLDLLDLGVDVRRTLLAKIDFGRALLPRSEIDAAQAAMLARVRAVPGVAHAALAEHDPYKYGRAVAAHTPARSPESLWHAGVTDVPMEVAVDSGFFRAAGVTSLRGRDFHYGDQRGAPRVAIINSVLATRLWPGEEPLGQCMLVLWEGGDCVTIVGVVSGFWKYSVLERNSLVVYVPIAQTEGHTPVGSMIIAVNGESMGIAAGVRRAIQSVRPDLPAMSVTPMQDIIRPEFRPWELGTTMLLIFGAVALAVAVVGLYGVVTFTAAQRSTEIAVRIALGAKRRHVVSLVVGDAFRAVLAGVIIGGLAWLAAHGWVGPLLFQTSPRDPVILLLVALLLLCVAAIASAVPALRSTRANPATILRIE